MNKECYKCKKRGVVIGTLNGIPLCEECHPGMLGDLDSFVRANSELIEQFYNE